MRRRTFITWIGGGAALPLVARAQQREQMRRIGVLIPWDENDPLMNARIPAFTRALADLGWADGRNVRMVLRWTSGDANRIRGFAQELVGLYPDIIVEQSRPGLLVVALQQQTRTISICFANVNDPVASGVVARLDRPSGAVLLASPAWKLPWEVSGLSCYRRSLPGSSGPQSCSIPTLPPYRPICPHLRRRPDHSRSCRSLRPFIRRGDRSGHRRAWAGAGRRPCGRDSGLFLSAHRAQSYWRRLETMYRRSIRHLTFVRDGGLLSYGPDWVDNFVAAATYVDRILRGATPRDLPVQFPTKYEMAVNSRPPRRLALPCRNRFCCAPTR